MVLTRSESIYYSQELMPVEAAPTTLIFIFNFFHFFLKALSYFAYNAIKWWLHICGSGAYYGEISPLQTPASVDEVLLSKCEVLGQAELCRSLSNRMSNHIPPTGCDWA